MILVDTSVWIDHFRTANTRLATILDSGEALCHPFIIGELACGRLTPRQEILSLLRAIPQSTVASHDEVLAFVDGKGLMGTGIGWIDAHLLAAVALSRARLWTLDRCLKQAAESLHVHVEV